jgi:hypothetical protein
MMRKKLKADTCAVVEGSTLSGCGLVRGGGAILGAKRWRLNTQCCFLVR